MGTLPCGHLSHSQNEEQRWASPEFQAETRRWKHLLRTLDAQLRDRTRLNPGPYPPWPDTYENRRIYEVKQHFDRLKRRVSPREYFNQVSLWEQANREFLDQPPCLRDRGFPLIPAQVPDLLKPTNLTVPRTGGRRRSRKIQERNVRIAELRKAGNDASAICRLLDAKGWAVPDNWRREGVATWRQAYRRKTDHVHKLFSTIAPKGKKPA